MNTPINKDSGSGPDDLMLKTKIDIAIASKGYIHPDKITSPAVLAGILGIPVPMVYQARQDGKLPSNAEASYRDCIQHYINFYKKKINSRSTSMAEAKLAQDIRNGIAKEELSWLEVKKLKMELLEASVMKELFEPVFHIIRASLVNLARKHPDIRPEIDNMMESWNRLGEQVERKAHQDSIAYVQSMLEKELTLVEAEEKVLSKYEIEKELEGF